jgi:hypothetical protein
MMGKPQHWFSRITLLGFLISLSVPALGNVQLAFDSTSLDFGSVPLLGVRELALEVWDTQAAPVEIDQISVDGLDPGDFSIVSPIQYPFVLNPGTVDTQQIILQFSPQAYGARSGQLVIETDTGTVTMPLTGFGSGGAILSWAFPEIDFGTISPGSELDTTIELYSIGTDTAFIDDIMVASSDTSFAAQFPNTITPPVMLAPGDSIAVEVAFRGLSLPGMRDAALTTFGNQSNNPSCNLIGDDEFGSFTTVPSPLIDFGIMYAGQILDTTIELINTGDVSLLFESPDVSIFGEDFTLLNPTQFPYTLDAGDTLSIRVRANPGTETSHRGYLQILSPQAQEDDHYQEDTLTVLVIPPLISAPVIQALSYYCAIASIIPDTIPISNAGPEQVVVTSITSSDSSITLFSDVSFPDTIAARITQPMIVHFTPSSAVADTLIVAIMGGIQTMLTDTLALQPAVTNAATSIVTAAAVGTAEQQVEVSAANGLTEFHLDSIVVHIAIQDSNVATIDPSSIKLAPNIANASIASIQAEPGGYAVTVTSTSPMIVPAGNLFVEMNLNRFVSNTDSTGIMATFETPALTGCLNWTADTVLINGPEICGSSELQNFLSHTPMSMVSTLRANPVLGQNAELTINASEISDARYELMNALGEMLSSGNLHLAPGVNNYEVSTSGMPAGVYSIRLTPEIGIITTLRFVKID